MKPRVLFSDIDGTLVHYPDHFGEYASVEDVDESAKTATLCYKQTGERVPCVVLSSLTGGKAYMSTRTLELVKQIRDSGVLFVLITGARSSTYMQRRAQLPPADYEFFENGGRVLAKGKLDQVWTKTFDEQIGGEELAEPVPNDFTSPEKRKGELWDLFRELVEEGGWYLDARDYFTDFRVDFDKSSTSDAETKLALKVSKRPALASSMNLGKADVYPARSGKRNAALEVLRREEIPASESVAMFDDDNDIELGELCARAFLPSVTHPSVVAAVEQNLHWSLMKSKGVKGTEEALECVLALVREQDESAEPAEPAEKVSAAAV